LEVLAEAEHEIGRQEPAIERGDRSDADRASTRLDQVGELLGVRAGEDRQDGVGLAPAITALAEVGGVSRICNRPRTIRCDGGDRTRPDPTPTLPNATASELEATRKHGESRHNRFGYRRRPLRDESRSPPWGPQHRSDYSQLAADCAAGAQECATACVEGVDVAGLEQCAETIRACLEANPDDPAACKEPAEGCLAAAGVDASALAECSTACAADFGDCAPPPTDPNDAVDSDALECVDTAADCLAGCADALGGCEVPPVECDEEALDGIAACVEAAGTDVAAIIACVESAGPGARFPTSTSRVSPRGRSASRRALRTSRPVSRADRGDRRFRPETGRSRRVAIAGHRLRTGRSRLAAISAGERSSTAPISPMK
jgi:hypothetical protein